MCRVSKSFKTSIGGQALIEGIMMKGPRVSAMAIREPGGGIYLEEWANPSKKFYNKIPFLRGIFNFIETLVSSYKCLMKSADISSGDLTAEEPESAFEKWLTEKLGDKLMTVVTTIGAVLGIGLALLLFIYLPSLAVSLLKGILPSWSLALCEGLIKMAIFLVYLWAVSLMPDMKRLFEYHGAEHKTIACYEAGEELTTENIRKHSRFHPRCGTSFMFLVLFVSILVSSLITWNSVLVRTLLKVLLLPVVVGIAYELIRLAGRHDNLFTRVVSWPGLKIQRLTTREPHDDQIEIAVAAMTKVIPLVEGEDRL